MTRRTALLLAVVLMVVILALGVLIDRAFTRIKKMDRRAQPKSIVYADHSPHYVGVIEDHSLIIDQVEGYRLYAGRSPDFAAGHYVTLGWTGTRCPVIQDAIWRPNGVTVRFTSGHQIHVPSRYFVGGR